MSQPQAAHSDRAHATWSASSTSRNWACSGALALGQLVDKLDVESPAAAWGTACHEVSEKCLRTGLDAESIVGSTIKTKQHSFEVDDEMAECAQEYIDYVRSRMEITIGDTKWTSLLWIEERFSLAKLDPPFDAGGTCDAIVYNPGLKLLEVIDLKGGRGMRVEVTENKQLRTYALGAMLLHPDLDVERVKSTIVQPRMEHKDGRIRSEEFHIADLAEWTADLVAAMKRSAEAIAAHADIKGDLMREAWAEKYVKQGDHCAFCPAAGICPALEKKAMATANAFFSDSGAVAIRNQPSELDPARLAQVLDGADDLQNWLNAVRALATRLAETGTTIPGYYLAEKTGHRKFKDPDKAPAVLKAVGVTDEQMYAEPKLKSPAQIEKTIGKKGLKRLLENVADEPMTVEAYLNSYIHKPITGKSLVSAAKSSKPAVKPAAEAFFA